MRARAMAVLESQVHTRQTGFALSFPHFLRQFDRHAPGFPPPMLGVRGVKVLSGTAFSSQAKLLAHKKSPANRPGLNVEASANQFPR